MPQIVVEAGALADAYDYPRARALLRLHLTRLSPGAEGAAQLLLGRCAMHGCGRNWQGALQRAHTAFADASDPLGVARVRLYWGKAAAACGQLRQANQHLKEAVASLRGPTQAPVRARAQRVLAEVQLWQKNVSAAHQNINAAVAAWSVHDNVVEEALARLIRAQVACDVGDTRAAARDMLWAERLANGAISATAQLRIRLLRAESLLRMNLPHRAMRGLHEMSGAVEPAANPWLRAHHHRLLGCALLKEAPSDGHRALLAATQAFGELGQSYFVAQCELALLRCEQRLHMPTRARLRTLAGMPMLQWPLLQDELYAVQHPHAEGLVHGHDAIAKPTASLTPAGGGGRIDAAHASKAERRRGRITAAHAQGDVSARPDEVEGPWWRRMATGLQRLAAGHWLGRQ